MTDYCIRFYTNNCRSTFSPHVHPGSLWRADSATWFGWRSLYHHFFSSQCFPWKLPRRGILSSGYIVLATSESVLFHHLVQEEWGILSTSSRHPAAPVCPPLWKCRDLKHTQPIYYYRYGVTNRLLQGNTGTHCPIQLYISELKSWRSGSHATYLTGSSTGFVWVVVVGTTEKSAVWRQHRFQSGLLFFPSTPPSSSIMNASSFSAPIALCAKLYQHCLNCARNICSHVFLPWVDSVGLSFIILLG